jgi:PPOX class probable FMN-dependent enzyme
LANVTDRVGEPDEPTKSKILDHIDEYARLFIAHSPFLTMATASSKGADCSPRGDEPGFVKVLERGLLAIPDRLGNKLTDSFRNLAENPQIGLLFFVPGVRETLRVNGEAYPTDEPEVLARLVLGTSAPQVATIVEVKEAYFHCGRALLRSGLWNIEMQRLARDIPSFGTILEAQLSGVVSLGAEALDGVIEDTYQRLR